MKHSATKTHAGMTTFVIKNLPDDLRERLKRRAERNHRSVKEEVIAIIEAAVDAPEPAASTMEERMEAFEAAAKPKKLGLLRGKLWIAPDFDAPLPRDYPMCGNAG